MWRNLEGSPGLFLILGASLIGCTGPEYDLGPDLEKVWGEPNPADPEDEIQTDRVLQVIEPTVDALWVVDNSLSMNDDNAALAANFPRFIEPFVDAAVDWHIGVVNTDMNNAAYRGKLIEKQGVRWVDAQTIDPVGVFTEMTTEMAASFTGYERGRDAAFSALTEHAEGANAGFRRNGAYLHVTVVTDEEDDSLGPVMNGSYGGKDDFVDLLNSMTDPSRNTFNSIVALSDTELEERGQKYIDLTDRLGGAVLNLNSGDWSAMLDELGGLQAPPPTGEFFLSRVPIPETLVVYVVWSGITYTYVNDTDFVWDRPRNSILFVNMPPMGSAVEITYTVASSQVE